MFHISFKTLFLTICAEQKCTSAYEHLNMLMIVWTLDPA